MGVENNNAVLATTWNESEVERIKEWIETLPTEWAALFAIVPAIVNFKTTIVMCPDGSKEYWDISNTGNDIRKQFIAELVKADYEDGSSPWDWIEVGYGEFGQKVLFGNNQNCYSDEEYATDTV